MPLTFQLTTEQNALWTGMPRSGKPSDSFQRNPKMDELITWLFRKELSPIEDPR